MISEATFQISVISAVYSVAIFVSPLARLMAGARLDAVDREPHLDGLRGLAAVGVVACHINQYMVSFWGFSEPALGDHLGILGVQLFFALTAFLFTARALDGKLDPERFYIGRIRRILPLYLAVSIGALATAWFFTRDIQFSLYQMASEIIRCLSFGFWKTDTIAFRGVNMLSLIGITWTLSYEWIFYLLLVPAYSLWRTGKASRICIVTTIAVLATRDFIHQAEQVIWPFFLPGILAALLRRQLVSFNRSFFLILSVPAIALVFWLPGYWVFSKLALVLVIFCAASIGRPRWLAWRPLRTLGALSYSIYLTQYLVLYSVVQNIYVSPEFASIQMRMAACAFVLLAIILLSALTYRFIELPWLRQPKGAVRSEDLVIPTPAEPVARAL